MSWNRKKGMDAVRVFYKDGGSKDYSCTGYKLGMYKFGNSQNQEKALLLFKGHGKGSQNKPTPLRYSKIKTFKALKNGRPIN